MTDSKKNDGGRYRRDVDYSDDPLEPHENRQVRRTFDDVNELVGDRDFKLKLRSTIRAWVIWIGMAATAFGALATLRTQAAAFLRWIMGASP